MKASQMLEHQQRLLHKAKLETEDIHRMLRENKQAIEEHTLLASLIKSSLCPNCNGKGSTLDLLHDSTLYCKDCDGTGFKDASIFG